METITHYASFPATGVSLRQMVQFGDRPSTGKFWNVRLFLCRYLTVQEPSFVPPNSSPKNSLSALRTE